MFSVDRYGTDQENLFNNQQLLSWLVISFILITLIFDSVVIMYREIRCWSLLVINEVFMVTSESKFI